MTPVPLEGGSQRSTSGPQLTLATEDTTFVYIDQEVSALYLKSKGVIPQLL
jgi:hypothetical protein